MIREILLLSPALSLVACHVVKPPPVAVTVPAAITTSVATSAAPIERVAVRKTTVERLNFRIDSARSSGQIATTLDPHGLGPRFSQCRCPLRGSVTGELTSRPDGTRSLSLDSLELITGADGHLFYNWSPLIGSIKTFIPSGKLIISRNSIPGPFLLGPRGQFEKSGNKFTVDGIAHVAARGLVLKKAVGEKETDLSIDQTDAVRIAGSLIRRDGSWILHVPAAVLKDRFDLDDNGSTMDLNFTASITAVAE